MGFKKTTKQFIEDALKIHRGKFDYSLTHYKGVKEKIQIICPNNHIFEQSPNDHLNGHGCNKCSGWGQLKSLNREFIKRLKTIHGKNLNFSNSSYKGWNVKVEVECFKHGMFFKTPADLLSSKQGCPKCGYEKGASKNRMGREQFIERGNQIHNNKYDYTQVEYINSTTPITIICPNHGKFLQRPKDHLNQIQGCPICKESKGEKRITNILKHLNINFYKQYKFEECFNKRPLIFDFYLPDKNICIEFDGEQHFSPVEKFGGVKSFKYIQLNDEIKNEFCIKNDITLIRINYKQINKVKQIIEKYV
jgi:very-short-patch-repair endonuclease